MILDTSNEIRSYLIDSVRKELVGPNLGGRYVDYYRQVLNLQDQDELILADPHGAPWERYISGKLYPTILAPDQGMVNTGPSDENTNGNEESDPIPGTTLSDEDAIRSGLPESTNTVDPISMANIREPSAFGLTIMAKRPTEQKAISIVYNAAYYEAGPEEINKLYRIGETITPRIVRNEGTNDEKIFERLTNYWIRRQVPEKIVNIKASHDVWRRGKVISLDIYTENRFNIKLYVTNRGTSTDDVHTLTFTIVNESRLGTNAFITYQNHLQLKFSEGLLHPYSEKLYVDEEQEDERQMQLLYRENVIFGIGHGCSVTWKEIPSNKIECIETNFLPVYSVPLVAPGPTSDRKEDLELSMWHLSDVGNWTEGERQLINMVRFYEKWINETEASIVSLAQKHVSTANANVQKCREALRRIREGVELLLDPNHIDLRTSFQWMNRAMLWQQQRSKVKQRRWYMENEREMLSTLDNGEYRFSDLEIYHNSSTPGNPRGRWRPFQLAFILMNLKAMWFPDSSEREIVELIWFPTGGGKTEAYLGLTAFSIFARKHNNNDESNSGTTILMRYTLRLLTSQQFERAASLILGCNLIAKQEGFEGEVSIGLWVGTDTTPNSNRSAVEQFDNLQSRRRAKYNFVLLKCPCCGAQIGKTNFEQIPFIKGLAKYGSTVKFVCENSDCEFYADPDFNGIPTRFLPVYVIDDEIFEHSPTLVLGTVDKFAMVPWKCQDREGNRDLEKVSRLFGFRQGPNGLYRIKPPELIIQDELHLIAGPLGSMVGMYETLIQTLCNQYRTDGNTFYSESFIPPKIVASSATITRAEDQIRGLYGTDKFQIFPAQGISFGETWFSYVRHERTEDNEFYKEGRNYIGIVAPGKSAQQTIYKIYAAIYQAVFAAINKQFSGNNLPSPTNIDYYWTLIGYFNSIRELAGALTLVNGNLAEYLNRIKERNLLADNEYRLRRGYFIYNELTSRIPGYKIPDTLKKLETSFTMPASTSRSMDICLATNMIATGLDVSRLGMMFIHGQPKTTAEYIQASSRVGRQFWEGPGLVFTLYSNQKPRDKSIYEHFQAYHSRLYSYVEPTSVTPYSVNVRERALHAIIIGLVRNFSRQYRYDPRLKAGNELNNVFDWILERVIKPRIVSIGVDTEDRHETERRVLEIKQWWNQDIYQRYGDAGNVYINRNPDQSRNTFIAAMGSETPENTRNVRYACIPTPTSMRGVDGECLLDIPILNL